MDNEIKETNEATAPEQEAYAGGCPACDCGQAASKGDFESRLRAVLDKVRPFLQMDGGDIELLAIEDKNALVRLTGACHGCPSAAYTLKLGVEQAIRREIPDFGELIHVE